MKSTELLLPGVRDADAKAVLGGPRTISSEFEFLEIWRFSNRLDLLGVVSFGFVGSLEFVVFRCVVGSGIGPIHSSTGGRFEGLVTRGDERSHSSSSIW